MGPGNDSVQRRCGVPLAAWFLLLELSLLQEGGHGDSHSCKEEVSRVFSRKVLLCYLWRMMEPVGS